MTKKLTLSIDADTIAKAKRIARQRGKSLSKMVEEYFKAMQEKERNEGIVRRVEERIAPYLSAHPISEDADYRELIREWKLRNYFEEIR